MRQIAATRCCNRSHRVTCENHCHRDRFLSLRSVARIQTGLNSCDRSLRQNKRKQPCRIESHRVSECATSRCDKSLRQNLNQPMREHQLVSRDPSKKTFKMASEHVDQDKQPEQSEVSSTSRWNVTTSRMVIEFYKENRALWDKNHKDYGKNSVQKKLFTPLVAKLK